MGLPARACDEAEEDADRGREIAVLELRGGTHVVVEKQESEGRTITRIEIIEGEERRRELARMLSGRIDEASLAHASELLVSGR